MLAVGGGDLWLMSTPTASAASSMRPGTMARDWTRISVKAADCPRIDKALSRRAAHRMGERWFRQEYLCEFERSPKARYSRDALIERAFTDRIKPLVLD